MDAKNIKYKFNGQENKIICYRPGENICKIYV